MIDVYDLPRTTRLSNVHAPLSKTFGLNDKRTVFGGELDGTQRSRSKTESLHANFEKKKRSRQSTVVAVRRRSYIYIYMFVTIE